MDYPVSGLASSRIAYYVRIVEVRCLIAAQLTDYPAFSFVSEEKAYDCHNRHVRLL
jgi:hypothetical protein